MYRHNNKTVRHLALVAGVAVSLQMLMPAGDAAPTTVASAQTQVAQGKTELAKGRYDKAIELLTKATKQQGMAPGSCDGHFCLGKAFIMRAKATKSTNPTQSKADLHAAKRELRTAIRVGRGNVIAKQANQFMMANLPASMLTPKLGEGTELIAARLGLRGQDRGSAGAAKPRVFEFYADWCEPCKMLKPVISKIKEQYGDQVEVTSINVDEKGSQDMMDQYDVSPIPTVIYLNPDGQVVGYSIGFSGEKSVEKELKKILPTNPS